MFNISHYSWLGSQHIREAEQTLKCYDVLKHCKLPRISNLIVDSRKAINRS